MPSIMVFFIADNYLCSQALLAMLNYFYDIIDQWFHNYEPFWTQLINHHWQILDSQKPKIFNLH